MSARLAGAGAAATWPTTSTERRLDATKPEHDDAGTSDPRLRPRPAAACSAMRPHPGALRARPRPVAVTLAAPERGADLDQIRSATNGTDPTILTGNVYIDRFAIAAGIAGPSSTGAFDEMRNDAGVWQHPDRHDRARRHDRLHPGRRDAGHDADLHVRLGRPGRRPGAPQRRLVNAATSR